MPNDLATPQWVVRDEMLSGPGVDVYSFTAAVPEPSAETMEASRGFAARADEDVSAQDVQEYLDRFFPASSA